MLTNLCQALLPGGDRGDVCRARRPRAQRQSRRGRRVVVESRPVHVAPIKPTLTAPGTKRLKLRYDKLLSTCAFEFKLCRYIVGAVDRCGGHLSVPPLLQLQPWVRCD